ncbi:MAG: hypothetical protein KDI79_00680 [Anaerolineae bacterium]|nr:hypothetical protein [Anaerolineae bacterium]
MTDLFNAAYYNSVDQIFHAPWTAAKLARLELVQQSIKTLWPQGHPTHLIHVTGTSGKGSTCRFLEAGLSLLGPSGAFLSPHIFDYRERFSLNGQPAAQDEVVEAWENKIKPFTVGLALSNPQHALTFHEVNILIALALFEKHGIERAAFEVGVGGRYDQTRALDYVATVLTNIGHDHEHMLGQKKWQRALDKAGIARPGVPFFTSESDEEMLRVIAGVCESVEAPLHHIDQANTTTLTTRLAALPADIQPRSELLTTPYQQQNAALSLAVIQHLYPEIDQAAVLPKFLTVNLLGRLLPVEDNVYADIAHNPEKISAFTQTVTEKFGQRGKIFVVGVSGFRTPATMFGPIMAIAKTVIVTSASYKGQDPTSVKKAIDAIAGATPVFVIPDSQQALQLAKSMREPDDVIILTGSAYLIDQALNPDPYLRYLNATQGWREIEEINVDGRVQFKLPGR